MLIETRVPGQHLGIIAPQRQPLGPTCAAPSMLLTVLEKRNGRSFRHERRLLNIAGGIRVDDPAIDSNGIVSALISSGRRTIPTNVCFAGEVYFCPAKLRRQPGGTTYSGGQTGLASGNHISAVQYQRVGSRFEIKIRTVGRFRSHSVLSEKE